MARQKKYKATITDSSYMEDLIWMSYRYCIGRKTIAAHSHAGDIAKNSYNDISENRRVFMAKDIRQEINDILRWRKNVDCHDYREDLTEDAFSAIIYRVLEKYGPELPAHDIWNNVKFDVENGQVTMSEYEGEKDYESFESLFNDLLPWIKLANALDSKCHRVITTVYEGKKEEHICFPYPSMDYSGTKIGKKWVDVESYRANPYIDRYFDEQYITEISESYE